eukprot:762559-Hanusia_phi.AAC.8
MGFTLADLRVLRVCPALACPALACPALACPALACPALTVTLCRPRLAAVTGYASKGMLTSSSNTPMLCNHSGKAYGREALSRRKMVCVRGTAEPGCTSARTAVVCPRIKAVDPCCHQGRRLHGQVPRHDRGAELHGKLRGVHQQPERVADHDTRAGRHLARRAVGRRTTRAIRVHGEAVQAGVAEPLAYPVLRRGGQVACQPERPRWAVPGHRTALPHVRVGPTEQVLDVTQQHRLVRHPCEVKEATVGLLEHHQETQVDHVTALVVDVLIPIQLCHRVRHVQRVAAKVEGDVKCRSHLPETRGVG